MLGQRLVHRHQRREPADVHRAIAEGARHARVHLRDQRRGRLRRCERGVDRGAQRHVAMRVRRRYVQQRGIERQDAVPEQERDLGQEDRHVVGTPLRHRLAEVAATEERVGPEGLRHPGLGVRRIPLEVQVHCFHILQLIAAPRQRCQEHRWRRRTAVHEDPGTGSNQLQRFVGGHRAFHASLPSSSPAL
jgi:hypothetical protein